MTVSTTTTRNEYTGAGGTKAFAFTFRCDDSSWVKVYLDGVLQSSGYSVAVGRYQDTSPGGTVTLVAAPDGKAVEIRRVAPLTQEVDLQAYRSFPAESLEDALDRTLVALQDEARDRADGDQAIRDDLEALAASGYVPADLAAAIADAEAAQAAAELAESGAEAAKTDAEGAEASAVAAQSAAESAQAAAEAARDAAMLSAGVYATTAAGLAATSEGDYFSTPSGDSSEYLILYRHDAGPVATEIASYPSAAAVYPNPETARVTAIRANTANAARPFYGGQRYKPVLVAAPSTMAYLDDIDHWVLTDAAVNANGTITLEAGGSIATPTISSSIWTGIGLNQVAYLWVSELAPSAAGSALEFTGLWNGAVDMTPYIDLTEIHPGVRRMKLTNDKGNGTAWTNLKFTITNSSGSPVTIYPLMVTSSPLSEAPRFRRFDATEGSGATKQIRRFDFWNSWGEDRAARRLAEKTSTKSADSVSGNDSNAGTSIRAAKQNLSAITLATGDTLGLWRGSEWAGRVPTSAALNDIAVQDVAAGAHGKALPVITALVAVDSGDWTDNADGTYSYTFSGLSSEVLVNNAYDEVYAVEVETAAEAATPIAAARRMRRVAAKATVITTAGSDFVESLGGNSWRVTIRPSDSLAPGTGGYRYEVTKYYHSVYMTNDPAGRMVSGLQLEGAVFGYGELALPHDSDVDRCVLLHGPIHQAVIHSGSVRRSLLYSADTDEGALTFYSGAPDAHRFDVRDSFIFAPSGVLSHNGGDANYYKAGTIRRCAFIAERKPWNGALWSARPVSCGAVDLVLVEDCYIQNAATFCVGNNATIRRNAAKGIARVIPQPLIEHNIVQMEPWSDPDNVNNRGMRFLETGQAASAVTRNNLFHWRDTTGYGDGAVDLYRSALTGSFTKNIHLFDATGLTIGTFPSGGPTWTADYNVYIVADLGATGEVAYVWNSATLYGYETYVADSGQDAHSLFVDLRNDPRGLKAVFVDPDNGDYRWAATDIALQVAEFCRANDVGPDWTLDGWPEMPTVDEAAQLIQDA